MTVREFFNVDDVVVILSTIGPDVDFFYGAVLCDFLSPIRFLSFPLNSDQLVRRNLGTQGVQRKQGRDRPPSQSSRQASTSVPVVSSMI